MLCRVIKWPDILVVRLTASSNNSAALIAETIREVMALNKPWYGLRLMPKTQVLSIGKIVTVKIFGPPKPDLEGLQYNQQGIGLEKMEILENSPLNQAARLAPEKDQLKATAAV